MERSADAETKTDENKKKSWYYNTDGHGNVRVLTNENISVIDNCNYDACGNLSSKTGRMFKAQYTMLGTSGNISRKAAGFTLHIMITKGGIIHGISLIQRSGGYIQEDGGEPSSKVWD